MILRPTDDSGDILPVLSSSALLTGARAVARLVEDRLNLYAGDWWENPARGNRILEMLRESRLTESDARALATYLTSYIRETEGVNEVKDVTVSVDNERRFSYLCTVVTENGDIGINYAF